MSPWREPENDLRKRQRTNFADVSAFLLHLLQRRSSLIRRRRRRRRGLALHYFL